MEEIKSANKYRRIRTETSTDNWQLKIRKSIAQPWKKWTQVECSLIIYTYLFIIFSVFRIRFILIIWSGLTNLDPAKWPETLIFIKLKFLLILGEPWMFPAGQQRQPHPPHQGPGHFQRQEEKLRGWGLLVLLTKDQGTSSGRRRNFGGLAS